jgi:hypothetical protein
MKFYKIDTKNGIKEAFKIIEEYKDLSPKICKMQIINHPNIIPIVIDYIELKEGEYNEDGILFTTQLSNFSYYAIREGDITMGLYLNTDEKSIRDKIPELMAKLEHLTFFDSFSNLGFDRKISSVEFKRHLSIKNLLSK